MSRNTRPHSHAQRAQPLNDSALGRWFILGVASVAGFVMWMRQHKHTYTSFDLVALFCVAAALVSAVVSTDPATAVLKVLSLFGASSISCWVRAHPRTTVARLGELFPSR